MPGALRPLFIATAAALLAPMITDVHATTIRFNCGSEEDYVDEGGRTWSTDRAWTAGNGSGFVGGWRGFSGIPCGGTPDPTLVFWIRGDWAYRFDPLPNGDYIVEMQFSEFLEHGPGNRVFDIRANGVTVIDDLDIFEDAGMNRYAIRYRFPVTVTTGQLDITTANSLNNTVLGAIAIWDQAPDGVPPSAPPSISGRDGLEQTQIHWDDVADPDVEGWRVYRAPSIDGFYALQNSELLHRRRYFDQGLTFGATAYYYVTAVDIFGHESAPSDTVSVRAGLRTEETLPVYEIFVSATDLDILNDDPESDTTVPATFKGGVGEPSQDVEVRYRGHSTRTYPKKSWKVRFPPGVFFEGRDILNLNAENADLTLIREQRAYELLKDYGVRSPQASFVRLLVNGQDMGLYTSVEDLDQEFLDRVGLPGGGNLYRCYDNLVTLPDSLDYVAAYEKKTNESDPEGHSDIIQFIELLNQTPTADLYRTLLGLFDYEEFYRYYACNAVLGNIDFGSDDYYLYHDLVDDYWYWLPWDYNETWGATQNWQDEIDTDTGLFPATGNRLIGRSLANPHFKRRHIQHVQDLFADRFSTSTVQALLDSTHAAVAEGGRKDWFKWGWESSDRFDAGVSDLMTYHGAREAYIDGRIDFWWPDTSLVINELLAKNNLANPDEFGEFDDWLELHNPTPDPVNVLGWTLSDDVRDPLKFALPDVTIPGGGFLVVWCDNQVGQGPLHANFKLGENGEWVGLFGPAAESHPPVDTYEYPDVIPDVSFGRLLDGGFTWGHMPIPTPGASNVTGGNIVPQISDVMNVPDNPTEVDTVSVTAEVWDDSGLVSVDLWANDGGGYVSTPMSDDGTGGDTVAGDGIFTARLLPRPDGTTVNYYVEAMDDSAAVGRDPFDAPTTTHTYIVNQYVPPLYINEFLASNATINQDAAGDFDDWVEIYNGGADPIPLGGMFLTDNLGDTNKWMFPDTTLAAGEFLLVWCDDEPLEGPLHATFKLSAGGEQVGLFETLLNNNVVIDSLTFGAQATDDSFGRFPDGTDNWMVLRTPTPGAPNSIVEVPELPTPRAVYLAGLRPNPVRFQAIVAFGLPEASPVRLALFDISGRRVRLLHDGRLGPGHHRMIWDGRDDARREVGSGMYFLRLEAGGEVASRKVSVLR